MATFNQQGQNVGQQYNAEVLNITRVSNLAELISTLDRISRELGRATDDAQLAAGKGSAARANISDAIEEARKPSPKKKVISAKLEAAAEIVKDTVAVAGLFEALQTAAGLVATFF